MYPESPGYARNSETSQEAAINLKSKDYLYSTILSNMKGMAEYGVIVDEALEVCQKCHNRTYDRSTIAARFTELEAQGRIIRTNKTRKTPRNRKASVYVLKDYFQESMKFDKPKTELENLREENKRMKQALTHIAYAKTYVLMNNVGWVVKTAMEGLGKCQETSK